MRNEKHNSFEITILNLQILQSLFYLLCCFLFTFCYISLIVLTIKTKLYFIVRQFSNICFDVEKIHERFLRSITKNILLTLLQIFNISTRNDVNLHVAFCLIFANFSRINEFTYVNEIEIKLNFENYHIIKNLIIFVKNNFILHILIFNINSFRRKFFIFIVAIKTKFIYFVYYVIYTKYFLLHQTYCCNNWTKDFRDFKYSLYFQNMFENLKYENNYFDYFVLKKFVIWIEQKYLIHEIIILNREKLNNYKLYIKKNNIRIF